MFLDDWNFFISVTFLMNWQYFAVASDAVPIKKGIKDDNFSVMRNWWTDEKELGKMFKKINLEVSKDSKNFYSLLFL